MSKSVTYIIVTWNNESEIEDCLASLYKYSPKNTEVIVVDNNSSDKTVAIIRHNFPNTKLIESQENLGFAGGNNLALKLVHTDFICYLNPDVILTEDIISTSMDVLSNRSEIGIVASRLKNLDGSHQQSCFNFANSKTMFFDILHIGRIIPNFFKKKYFLSYYDTNKDYFPDWVIGAQMVLRTVDAKSVNGFSTEYYMYTEDMDLCKKVLVQLNKKTLYLTNSSLIHIGGASENQNVSYNKQKKMFENIILFVNKFYGPSEVRNTLKRMISAYKMRYHLLNIFYRNDDKQLQLDKTSQALSILEELRT
ncbi:hypothetical protein AT575_04135 [Streptococcus penaeicida]|uniref:Glycosyltransferase 2-like domain-containing protein n=1 Tax=Streptococcus penaeicida TaxID=1765960 RepID=A0A2N8LD26_9STRE|nr:glycosyltransferase family 2 protein [Streptococcus penaeicida]PND48069.1 hypothetical protein AT575_04135 [Streptococcus penaeicida]